MSDLQLDRELEQALAVDHSPEFLARVRTRIEAEQVRAGWGFRWVIAAGAAAAAVVVAFVAVAPPATVPPSSPSAPSRSVAAPAAARTAAGPRVPQDSTSPGTRVTPSPVREAVQAAVGSQPGAADVRPLPEVLISEDEVRVYRMLLGMVEQQPEAAQPARVRKESELVELPDVALMPLRIEALPPLARLEGERP
jgi:hypothetical protein